MIDNASIKIAIIQKYRNYKNEFTNNEILATEVLFYKYLLSFIKNNPEQKNKINELVSSYGDEFKLKFISLKNKATSYQNILTYLNKIDKPTLLSLKESEINDIYQLYITGEEIVKFDPFQFNAAMYGVSNISEKEILFLKNVHENYMIPIYNYANVMYGLKTSDLKIISANEIIGNAGKIIYFSTESVPIINIYTAIINKRIPIYNYKCELEYPNIKLIIL